MAGEWFGLMRQPSRRSPASATSMPSSSTWRRAGGIGGSIWCRSGTRCRSSTSRTRPASIGHEADVWAPRGSEALDYELELACVIGREARDLPDDDRALEAVAGFTIMNDWSARDLQRIEMAVGLGPSKGKDFATSLGPELVTFDELADRYRDGRLHLEMTASRNGRLLSRGDSGTMYWTWPQLLAHASRDATLRPGDVIGSGTVGTGCILELTPERAGGWLRPGRRHRAGDRAAGDPCATASSSTPDRSIGTGTACNAEEGRHAAVSATRLDPAEAAHRASERPGLQGRGDLLRRSRHGRRLLAGLQHRLSPAAADARGAGRAGRHRPDRALRRARAAASSPEDAVRSPARATRSRGGCRCSRTTT